MWIGPVRAEGIVTVGRREEFGGGGGSHEVEEIGKGRSGEKGLWEGGVSSTSCILVINVDT